MVTRLRLPRLKYACFSCVSLPVGLIVVGVFEVLLALTPTLLLEVSVSIRKHLELEFTFFDDIMLAAYPFYKTLSCIFLFVGLRKDDAIWMEPYLVMKGVEMLNKFFTIGVAIVARIFKHKHVFIFFQIAVAAIYSYMFTIVHSHHEDLIERHSGPSEER